MTLAAYPLVPKDEVGFRVQLTAANTDAEIDMLIGALEELAAARRAAHRRDVAARQVGGGVTWRSPPRDPRLALWQVYLAVGALLRAVRLGAAVRRQRPGVQPARALAGASRSSSACAGPPAASAGPWRWFAVGFLLFWLGRPLHVQLPAPDRRRGAVPVARRRAYVIVYPALMAGC